MKQKPLDMTNYKQETASNQTWAGLTWSVGIALTLALAVIFGRQFDNLSPSARAALANYFTALAADELSPFK